MNSSATRVANAIAIATTDAFADASNNIDYRDGMRYMRAEILKRITIAFAENNSRFDVDAFLAACRRTA